MKLYQLHVRSLLRTGCHSIDILYYGRQFILSKGGPIPQGFGVGDLPPLGSRGLIYFYIKIHKVTGRDGQ
jgi:hypothetical protein